jgi:hypothetical protein
MSYTVIQKHEKETNHGKWANLKSSNELLGLTKLPYPNESWYTTTL